jgi:hypothetical protein
VANLDVIRPASCTRGTGGVSVHAGNCDSFHLAQHGQVQLARRSFSESWGIGQPDGTSTKVEESGTTVVGGRSRVRSLRTFKSQLCYRFRPLFFEG